MRALLIASAAITIVLILCTIDDLLSLHDIRADYVSKSVLTYLRAETSEPLPSWTDTALEWTSITVSVAVRSVLVLSNLVILLILMKRLPPAGGVPGPRQ